MAMKRSQMIFTILLVPLDFLLLILAAISAYQFRIGTFIAEIRPVIYTLKFYDFILYAILTAIIWQIIFALVGLYNIRSNRQLLQEFGRIIVGTSIGLLIIIFAIFLQRELFSSRFIILAAWGFAIVYLTIGRAIVLAIQRSLFKRGLASIKVITIGSEPSSKAILDEFKDNPKHGFRVIKSFPEFSSTVMGEILAINEDQYLDEIIVTDPSISKEAMLTIIDFADENHFGFRYSPDIFNTVASNINIDTIAGVPLVELKKTPLDGWGKIAKRIFDIIGSLILIIITSPIMLLAAIAIKFESNGPVLFSKRDDGSTVTRVGQFGLPFRYFKFRSMVNKTDSLRYSEALQEQNVRKDSPLVKIVDDPRITKVGKFIRRLSIDELPELFLVLNGQMSLVGPRPHLPEEVAKYEKSHRKVLTIKPGITGMAQVSGRSDLSFDDEIKLDLFYIENWSLWLDLQILLKTPIAVLRTRKTL